MIKRGIQLALYENWEGIRLVLILRLWVLNIKLSRLLKKSVIPFIKPPELPDPITLTEKPIGKVIEPEDIINGTIEPVKPIEPEDM